MQERENKQKEEQILDITKAEKPDITRFIKESKTGKLSSSRLLVVSWGLGTLIVWIITSFISVRHGQGLQSLPESIVTVLGILVGGKTLQRFGENEKG